MFKVPVIDEVPAVVKAKLPIVNLPPVAIIKFPETETAAAFVR